VLRTLTRADWLDALHLDPSLVPDWLLLRGTRNLRRRYDVYRQWFTDVIEVGSPNGLFEDVLIGRLGDRLVGYASVYGPAMASEITHVFGVLGTRNVVVTGVCGGLADSVQAGDLVIASAAGCGEGAVACYLPGRSTISASADLVERAAAAAWEHRSHVGSVWTTAALLAEGEDELTAWRDTGHIAVDMETATVFGVAEWLGMRRVSVLSVFDNPLAGNHIARTAHDLTEARAAGERAADSIVRALISGG